MDFKISGLFLCCIFTVLIIIINPANVYGHQATPSFTSATTISSSRIDLVWVVGSTSNGHSQEVLRCTGVGCTPTTIIYTDLTNLVTTYSDTGLTQSTTYGYLIRSVHANNIGSSVIIYATTFVATVPSAPTGLSATPISSS